MYDVMVDLETTGVDPSNNAIIQLAAVRFDYETQTIGSIFNASMHLPFNRYWDEGTRGWWMSKIEVYQKITEVAEDPRVVMARFRDWCIDTSPALAATPQRFWSKPSHFDYQFIMSYSKQFGTDLESIFHYRSVVDMNSFLRGLAGDPGAKPLDKEVPFVGDAHNAIDDVLHQIKISLLARSMINAERPDA